MSSHLNTSLGDVRAEADAARWYRHESSRSLQDRIAALEIAERLHARRVQELAVREDVLHRTLHAVPRGPVKDWEQQVDEHIRRAVARCEPQPSASRFIAELEGRAVQLEYSLYQVRQRLTAVEKQERDVASREARVTEREHEVARLRESHEAVWSELHNREALVVAHEQELHDLEAELDAWSTRLQRRQASMLDAEQHHTQAAQIAAGTLRPPPPPPQSANLDTSSDAVELLTQEVREKFIDVADYLQKRHAALRQMEDWIQLRCAAIEEATARLHTLHVRVGSDDDASATDSSASPMPLTPERDDIHPFLQMFARGPTQA